MLNVNALHFKNNNYYRVDGYLLMTFHISDTRHTVAIVVLKHHAPRRRYIFDHGDHIGSLNINTFTVNQIVQISINQKYSQCDGAI